MAASGPTLSSSTQGRIITQNADLLALLRERTNSTMETNSNKPLRKIYINPPDADGEDDKYRFISTDVNDFNENQDYALQNSETARGGDVMHRGYQDRREDLRGGEHHRTGPGPSDCQGPQNWVDGSRYEDRNMKNQLYSAGHEHLALDTQFVVKEADRKSDHTHRDVLPSQQGPPIITPIRYPLRPKTHEEEQDEEDLQKEQEYQQQMQARIRYSEQILAEQETAKVRECRHT